MEYTEFTVRIAKLKWPSVRYSLRTFLLAVLSVAVVCGIVGRWQHANWSEHRGQIEVSALGGTYTMERAAHLKQTGKFPNWLYRRFFNRVAQVDLSKDAWPVVERKKAGQNVPPLTDNDLVVLNRFVNLRVLDLHGSDIGDGSLEHLARLRNLEHLDLTDTNLSESSVDRLRSSLPKCMIIR